MGADVAAVLDRAHAVLADLRAIDLDGSSDEVLSETVLSLRRLRGCLGVAEARVLARWDAQGCWRASGAKTGAAWLAWKERVPIGVARQRVRHARALRTLPAVEEAWGQGRSTGWYDRTEPGVAQRAAAPASCESVLSVRVESNNRTRADNVGGTSRTVSPAGTSCWASRAPSPVAPSMAQVRGSNRAANRSSRSRWWRSATRRSSSITVSVPSRTAAVWVSLRGSIPMGLETGHRALRR